MSGYIKLKYKKTSHEQTQNQICLPPLLNIEISLFRPSDQAFAEVSCMCSLLFVPRIVRNACRVYCSLRQMVELTGVAVAGLTLEHATRARDAVRVRLRRQRPGAHGVLLSQCQQRRGPSQGRIQVRLQP